MLCRFPTKVSKIGRSIVNIWPFMYLYIQEVLGSNHVGEGMVPCPFVIGRVFGKMLSIRTVTSRGLAKENCWWGAKPQFADKQTSFEPNLLTNTTFLEFCQQ